MDYMSSQGEVRTAHEYIHDSFAAVDASSYGFENRDVFLTNNSGDKKKKRKALEAKQADVEDVNAKELGDLKAVGSMENKTRNNEVKIGATKADKVAQLDLSYTSHAFAASTESSAFTEGNSKDNLQELQRPFPTKSTAAARFSRETLEKEIVDFTQDAFKTELPFPKLLNSQQRFDVHSIAEKLGLVHESRGEGQARYIVVSKPKMAPKGGLLGLFYFAFLGEALPREASPRGRRVYFAGIAKI